MSDPYQQLRVHAGEGRRLTKRLRYARTRPTAAKYVRALRRWHRDLRPLEEACGLSLGIDGAYYPTLQEAGPVLKKLDWSKSKLVRVKKQDDDFPGYTRAIADDPKSHRLYIEEHIDAYIELKHLRMLAAQGQPVGRRIKQLAVEGAPWLTSATAHETSTSTLTLPNGGNRPETAVQLCCHERRFSDQLAAIRSCVAEQQ